MQDIIQAWLDKQCGQISVATGAVVLVLPRNSTALVPAAHWPAGGQPDAELTAAAAAAYERRGAAVAAASEWRGAPSPGWRDDLLSDRGERPHRRCSGRSLRLQSDAAAPVGSRQRDARSGSISRSILRQSPAPGKPAAGTPAIGVHRLCIERCDAHSARAVRRGQRCRPDAHGARTGPGDTGAAHGAGRYRVAGRAHVAQRSRSTGSPMLPASNSAQNPATAGYGGGARTLRRSRRRLRHRVGARCSVVTGSVSACLVAAT